MGGQPEINFKWKSEVLNESLPPANGMLFFKIVFHIYLKSAIVISWIIWTTSFLPYSYSTGYQKLQHKLFVWWSI